MCNSIKAQPSHLKEFNNFEQGHSMLFNYLEDIYSIRDKCLQIAHIQKDIFEGKEIRATNPINNIPASLDSLFEQLDLEIYESHTNSALNSISRKDFEKAKALLHDSANGHSNLVFDESCTPQFRQVILLDLMILLCRPSSRELLFAIADYNNPITIKQNYETCEYSNGHKLNLFAGNVGVLCAKNTEGEAFFSPFPRFILLAHELIHALHDLSDPQAFCDLCQAVDSVYDNQEDRYTIEGTVADPRFITDKLCEQNILREFNLPIRSDHTGHDFNPCEKMDELLWDTNTPLHYALERGAFFNIKNYFDCGGSLNENIHYNLFSTLFSTPATENRGKIITLLIKQGANPDWHDTNNRTLLHFAALSANKKLCDLLLKKGLAINAQANDGMTPLHYAAIASNAVCIKFLIESGADPFLDNQQGDTPLITAARQGLDEALNVLGPYYTPVLDNQ